MGVNGASAAVAEAEVPISGGDRVLGFASWAGRGCAIAVAHAVPMSVAEMAARQCEGSELPLLIPKSTWMASSCESKVPELRASARYEVDRVDELV